MAGPVHYTSPEEDSARWAGFPWRAGDIVVSTRSKSGTTWMQMICALLVLGTADLPAPLSTLSPWLDHTIRPIEEVIADLEAQRHRRFVKTHTPLDGLPLDDRATYVVVARHPLDAAVSLYHQGDNLDRQRLAELTGVPAAPRRERPSLHDWLVAWTTAATTPAEQLDCLAGVLHHASDAWARRDRPNVLLVHYADLLADLGGEMRRIAARLGIEVAEEAWPALVEAATFRRMRADPARLAPNSLGILADPARFFREGRSGAGRETLGAKELAAYDARVAGLVPADLRAWLHR